MAGGGGDGGGGDGGYAAERAAEESRRRAARSRIARLFGISGGVDRGAQPSLSSFVRPATQAQSRDVQQSAFPNEAGPNTPAFGPDGRPWVPPIQTTRTVTDPRTGITTDVPYTQEELYDMPAYQAALNAWNAMPSDVASNLSAREAGYERIRNDVRGYHRNRLQEDLERAARQVRFAVLGSGNYGGSGQIDRQRDLDREYNRGILDIENLAETTAGQAEAADMNTYASLINQINAGMDEESAVTLAGQRIGTGVQSAIDQARGVSFGNVFDRLMGDLYNQQYALGMSRSGRQGVQPRTIAGTPGGSSYFGSSSPS